MASINWWRRFGVQWTEFPTNGKLLCMQGVSRRFVEICAGAISTQIKHGFPAEIASPFSRGCIDSTWNMSSVNVDDPEPGSL